MARAIVLFAFVLSLYATPAAALTVAPPGNSGVQQYLETVPTAGGNISVPPGAPGRHASSGAPLPRGVTRALTAAGPDGRAAAALASATAPPAGAGTTGSPPKRPGPASGQSGRSVPTHELATPHSSSLLHSVGQSLLGKQSGGGSGLGILLPALLTAALLGGLLMALRRRRLS